MHSALRSHCAIAAAVAGRSGRVAIGVCGVVQLFEGRLVGGLKREGSAESFCVESSPYQMGFPGWSMKKGFFQLNSCCQFGVEILKPLWVAKWAGKSRDLETRIPRDSSVEEFTP